MHKILLTDKAFNDFSKLDKPVRSRIATKLLEFADNPLKQARHLTNSQIGSYRFRIGDYRVVFDIDDETIVVLRIGHRSEIYR